MEHAEIEGLCGGERVHAGYKGLPERPIISRRGRRDRRMLHLRLEVRDHLLPKEANGLEHLLVLRRPNGTEQKDFLYAQGFVPFEKLDTLLWRADAE